jgi:dTDP-4-dehydrorhamnose 3,5-epimerase
MVESRTQKFETRQLTIHGAVEFRSLIHTDSRGEFARHFSSDMLGGTSELAISQANISRTIQEHTFRGMHYQVPPYAETKLISCLSGTVVDILVDLRPESSSYLKWDSVLLSEELNNLVYVPHGVANGYLSLTQNTLVHYYSTAPYSMLHERGFRYDDELIAIQLPSPPQVISSKDQSWGKLKESDFEVFRSQR